MGLLIFGLWGGYIWVRWGPRGVPWVFFSPGRGGFFFLFFLGGWLGVFLGGRLGGPGGGGFFFFFLGWGVLGGVFLGGLLALTKRKLSSFAVSSERQRTKLSSQEPSVFRP